jgi:hypothetical protein
MNWKLSAIHIVFIFNRKGFSFKSVLDLMEKPDTYDVSVLARVANYVLDRLDNRPNRALFAVAAH